jgi:hypothetical protein
MEESAHQALFGIDLNSRVNQQICGLASLGIMRYLADLQLCGLSDVWIRVVRRSEQTG